MDPLTQEQVEPHALRQGLDGNFWANRLCCEAADRAMPVHGGWVLSAQAVRNIYRHHRRTASPKAARESRSGKWRDSVGYMGREN